MVPEPSDAADRIHIRALGDSTLVVEVSVAATAAGTTENARTVDAWISARVLAMARAIRGHRIDGLLDVIPTLRTVGVSFDPLTVDAETLESFLRERVRGAFADRQPERASRVHRVPVRYGGEFGPDLAFVAEMAGLQESEVVILHSQQTYRVLMMGFSPGFAYMGSLPDALVLPRRSSPRTVVPAGSVAIAGSHTAIYPSATPGGWHLIGRTSTRPFVPEQQEPFLFKAGDEVQFFSITDTAGAETGIN